MLGFLGRGPALRASMLVACGLSWTLGPAVASASAQGNEILYVTTGGGDPTCASGCPSVQAAVGRAGQDVRSGAASSVLIEVGPGFYSGNVVIPSLPGTAPLTIQGAGASTELGGTGVGPVVTVPAGSRVAITDLSIVGGNALSGGGVNNAGTLTLLRDHVAFNTAGEASSGPGQYRGTGGGIFNSGSLTLQDSTVSNNQADSGGGGVANVGGTLNAARDAIVNNSAGPDAGAGGGLEVSANSYCCSVTDSTIAGNTAQGSVSTAGVYVYQASLRLYGDTIAANRTPRGVGGVYALFATVDLGGTLLAQNSSPDCNHSIGTIMLHGGDLADDASCPAELSGVDPQLQPLSNNGGPSQTMAIAASSPAYDANTLCGGTDQRAVSRLQLGASRCDIGAYQLSAPSTYVANPPAGSVTAYAAGASGDVAPTLALAGAGTGLSAPTGVVVDVSGRVFVANAGNNSITEYAPEASGNVPPAATIAGPLTQLNHPQDLALDPAGDLFVTNLDGSVTEYSPNASGNIAPKARIAGASVNLSQPTGIVIDPSGALRVSDDVTGTINTYRAGSNGNVAAVSRLTIGGGAARPFGMNFDPSGNLVVADAAASQVDTFAASAAGSAPPLSLLSGTAPALAAPVGLDLDVFGDIFVANWASNTISEYPPHSHGSSSPLAMITGTTTGLSRPSFLSELPPPPAPRVKVSAPRRQSRRSITRRGITLKVRASGKRAFRSRPITLKATARAGAHRIAATRTTVMRPGHVSLLLLPDKHAARWLRSSRRHTVTAIITIHGGAGTQSRRLTIRLTR